ncbi:Z1 domain-containing protein [Deinococcus aquiradiocola]|uniref:Endonuclease n=1 Tax=Deinococcus aquiradiocola TaxID=393059 RepID=A0A917PCY2_9DEIO|nr:Z1 domain-containing protein [Deinococcus aquiradiocola]GGJ71334.1 endonuclease [Deinococcus aquiradiocola]
MAEGQELKQIDQAVAVTVSMLEAFHKASGLTPGAPQVRQQAAAALQMLGLTDNLLEEVVRQVELSQDTALDGLFVVPAVVSTEGDDPPVWEPATDTPLARRYLKLLEKEGWPVDARVRLGRTTRSILGRCGNPAVTAPWDRRGMVVGDVQSGKTTSYVSLICAAIDAGYRNIVVLGGRTNDLRHQTQERVDLGVTGRESSRSPGTKPKIGVGLIEAIPGLTTVSLTTQDHVGGKAGGDFSTKKANIDSVSGDNICIIAVVKKHADILNKLTGWFTGTGKGEAGPLLLIDDEADDASIDTNEPGESPTAINAAIRLLLESVKQSSYVAYTATPYANVMIDPEDGDKTHGDNLFPRNFIALLTAPPSYFGARRFLSRVDGTEQLVEIEDTGDWIGKDKLGNVPDSLCEAIREFVLVSAARRVRRAREQRPRQHETMLVHATVNNSTQVQVEEQIQTEVDRLRAGWDFPVGTADVRQEFETTWKAMEKNQVPALAVSWEELQNDISGVLEKLTVELINGVTKKNLDYRRATGGALTVIAVGGLKLSRGLTLEGLTTSYHTRTTKQHDTLMQMCRWFGYRTGYEDLCRLYSTGDLLRAFREVMESDEELREELEDMASLGASPMEFGLRVRTSPGMTITGRNKLKHAVTVRDALAGKTLEVTRTSRADSSFNDELLQKLVSSLGDGHRTDSLTWDGVPWTVIEETLEQFRELPSTVGLNGKIARALSYIRSAQSASPPRLLTWTVALAGLREGKFDPYGGQQVIRVSRTPRKDEDTVLNFGAISDPADEHLARGASAEGKTRKQIKQGRPKDEGLLIIYPIATSGSGETITTSGLAISFPEDKDMKKRTYVLNPIAQLQEAGHL